MTTEKKEGHGMNPKPLKRPEDYAKAAWAIISLGNIAKPANGSIAVENMVPVFAQAILDAKADAAESLQSEADNLAGMLDDSGASALRRMAVALLRDA